MCVLMSLFVFVFIFVSVLVLVCVRVYVYACVCESVCVFIYTPTYTVQKDVDDLAKKMKIENIKSDDSAGNSFLILQLTRNFTICHKLAVRSNLEFRIQKFLNHSAH